METNRFFLAIHRINSVLFLVLLTAGIFAAYFILSELSGINRANSVVIKSSDGKDKEETIELSRAISIPGHRQKYINVYSRNDGVLKSGGYTRTHRNILFLDENSKKPYWLLSDNNSVIISAKELSSGKNSERKTDFFLLEVASNDRNGDGRISESDGVDIGVSSPTGKDFYSIDQNISKVINYEYFQDSHELGILIQAGKEIRYRVYDLNKFETMSDRFVMKVDQ